MFRRRSRLHQTSSDVVCVTSSEEASDERGLTLGPYGNCRNSHDSKGVKGFCGLSPLPTTQGLSETNLLKCGVKLWVDPIELTRLCIFCSSLACFLVMRVFPSPRIEIAKDIGHLLVVIAKCWSIDRASICSSNDRLNGSSLSRLCV